MDCPLTNQGSYTFTGKNGAIRVKDPANQISANHSLDQSHEAILRLGAETGFIRSNLWSFTPNDMDVTGPYHQRRQQNTALVRATP